MIRGQAGARHHFLGGHSSHTPGAHHAQSGHSSHTPGAHHAQSGHSSHTPGARHPHSRSSRSSSKASSHEHGEGRSASKSSSHEHGARFSGNVQSAAQDSGVPTNEHSPAPGRDQSAAQDSEVLNEHSPLPGEAALNERKASVRRSSTVSTRSLVWNSEEVSPFQRPLYMMRRKVFEIRKLIEKLDEGEEQKEKAPDKYNDTPFGQICRNKVFEAVSISIVCLNAVWMGYTTDISARFVQPDNMYIGDPFIPVIENMFSVFFTSELILKTIGTVSLFTLLKDPAYLFDFVLVGLMVSETWIVPFIGTSPLGNLQLLRLLRLLRITRMAKLMRAFPELLLLVKGMRAAVRAVVWDVVLLLIVTYTWAILMTNEFHSGSVASPIDEFFGSMSSSMFSLLVMGSILDDITRCTDAIRATGNYWMLALFILYVVINSFTLLNMLVGVLAGVVAETNLSEKRRKEEEQIRKNVGKACNRLVEEDDSTLVKPESYKTYPSIPKGLEPLDIDYAQYLELGEILFERFPEGREVKELMFEMLRLQPSNTIGVLDMKSFQDDVETTMEKASSSMRRLDEACCRIARSFGHDAEVVNEAALRVEEEQETIDEVQLERILAPYSTVELVLELQSRLELMHSDRLLEMRETCVSAREPCEEDTASQMYQSLSEELQRNQEVSMQAVEDCEEDTISQMFRFAEELQNSQKVAMQASAPDQGVRKIEDNDGFSV